eukprot:5797256-Pyramimonas_sp.AAC.1
MEEEWLRLAALQPLAPTTASTYIKDSISYRADPQAADNRGQAYAAFTHTMEAFFCDAHGISEDDRQKFLGRGVG